MTNKSENKTLPTQMSVDEFIAQIEHPTRCADARAMTEVMGRITGEEPRMWGPTMIGFGEYHYKYESGREGDMFITGFAPRKANLVVYIMPGYSDHGEKLDRLGKHKIGKSCLYLNKLADVDMGVLEELIVASVEEMRAKYPTS